MRRRHAATSSAVLRRARSRFSLADHVRLSIRTALFLFLVAISSGFAETPIDSDAIVDGVGINVHLHYTDTVYNNFQLVQNLLLTLGVRHIRDALIDTSWADYYTRHNALGRQGIHSIFITSPQQGDTLLATYPSKMAATFEGFEAPNEYNQSNDPHWDSTLKDFLPRLYRIARKNPEWGNRVIVIGPSLTQPDAYPKMAGLQTSFDVANMHNYFAGRNPGTAGWGGGGYGSIDWNLQLARGAWDGKPIMTTETGFNTDPADKQGIPEEVEAKYIPRLILEQLNHHIQRTYIYELLDERPKGGGESAFGLVRNDGTKKPAFTALQSLIHIAKSDGHSDLKDLPFSFSGDTSDLHHLLARRADGVYLLFYWIETSSYDPDSKKEIPVSSRQITFSSPASIRSLQLASLKSDGTYTLSPLKTGGSLAIQASDSISVLEITTSSK